MRGVAGQRLPDRGEQALLELPPLPGEPARDALAHGCRSRLRLPVRRTRRQALQKCVQHLAGVADEPERGVGRADPLGRGVDLHEAAPELEPVLRRRLGTELRAGAEKDVGAADELLEGRLVAGRAGRELVILREHSLAHVRRSHRCA